MNTIQLSITLLTLMVGLTVQAKEKPGTTIYQEIIINAPIRTAWQVLGPQFDQAYKWASSIKHSEAMNTTSLNGSTCTQRGCSVKGMGEIEERLTAYSAENYSLAYEVQEGMPKMVKYASNNWQLVDLGNGKTQLQMNIEMKTGGFMGWLMGGMMKKKMTQLSREIAEEFKYYVENGEPHPRKLKS